MSVIVIAAFLAGLAGACDRGVADSCRKYSVYTCDELQKIAPFNVYFYYPRTNEEKYLGQVQGLPNCQDRAGTFAFEKKMHSDEWNYICCIETKKSQCAEKHK